MKNCVLLATLSALILAGFNARALGEYAGVDPKDVDIRLELVGPVPYPYQGVRIRATLVNVSKKRLERIPWRVDSPAFTGPLANDHYYTPLNAPFRDLRLNPFVSSAISDKETDNLSLDPQEQVAHSFAYAGDWRDWPAKDAAEATGWALFPKPSEYYRFRGSYPADTHRGVYILKAIKIQVGNPKGDDKAMYDILKNDPKLACLFLSLAHVPDKEMMAKIKALTDKYPRSSYTDYGRLALARGYMNGNNIGFGSGATTDETAAAAIKELEQIIDHDFAYRPCALVMLYIQLKRTDPNRAEKIARILNEKHPDADEWLFVAAESMKAEKWLEFRKRRPQASDKDKTEKKERD